MISSWAPLHYFIDTYLLQQQQQQQQQFYLLYGWQILRAVIGQFQVWKLLYGPLALDHLFKTGIINKAI